MQPDLKNNLAGWALVIHLQRHSIAGKQLPGNQREVRGIENFKGAVSLAGKNEGQDCYLGRCSTEVKDKHVVILGTGAFGLEALEAADRAGAKSITMISRERDRWIVPYAKQFKFICYSHIPFMPRSFRCWLTNRWLKSVYALAGVESMSPQPGSAHNFTGQCNDAFFRLAKQGRVRYVIGKVDQVQARSVKMATTGEELPADILIVGLGCEVQYQIPYLRDLQLGNEASLSVYARTTQDIETSKLVIVTADVRQDLHNFAFLGNSGRIGLACDWVWFNVPHGPQKQIRSFFSVQRLLRQGKDKAVTEALHPTPFNGCKGESMKVIHPSGLKARNMALYHTLAMGRSSIGKACLWIKLSLEFSSTWFLVCFMMILEQITFSGWMDHVVQIKD
ncbi:hypothetical protein WJX84_008370 [Apatococcus fuscideae]|uniref:Uncharacterized protein n=1 Tax=Apatococcus fuscideae TaxID=2026836 RepID=A0AAW1T820_9CHLO